MKGCKLFFRCIIGFIVLSLSTVSGQEVSSFTEVGTTLHAGDHTPLWQNSLQHGLSSTKNNAYLRGAVLCRDTLNRNWNWGAGIDLVAGTGLDADFFVQQAYVDLAWRCLDLSIGSKELSSNMLNQNLTSGGLVWSGNARPIPQVRVGIFEYTPLSSWLAIKGEVSYGWWTDGGYLSTRRSQLESIADQSQGDYPWYTKGIKYHHKSFYLRIGKPVRRWQLELGMRLDDQFGGYLVNQHNVGNVSGETINLGNSLEDYWKAFFPGKGNSSSQPGEQIQVEGNFLGSEQARLTYNADQCKFAVYLENYYDDFSGMGKLNGWDGLWGIEYVSLHTSFLSGVLFEYYQTTNQSGSLHGVDGTDATKTGGADNYYNNYLYQGWSHWGQTMANPLIASPAYFADQIVKSVDNNGTMGFPYNRVKAYHIGFSGTLTQNLNYRLKLTHSETWGTPFSPTLNILSNNSAFFEVQYRPYKRMKNSNRWKGVTFTTSLAGDRGDIYGDNLGWQFKVRKEF